jgi:hypothetical protein
MFSQTGAAQLMGPRGKLKYKVQFAVKQGYFPFSD